MKTHLRRAALLSSAFITALCLSGNAHAQKAGWYLGQKGGSVSCALNSGTVNLGAYSRITDTAPPRATGNWGVQCSSNVYQGGYPEKYHMPSGGYCVIFPEGDPYRRLLTGESGAAKGLQIPFQFFFARQKPFETPWNQDYTDPIGNGQQGIPYIDWNYIDGPDNCHNNPDITSTRGCGAPVPLPGRGEFDLQILPSAGRTAWPAGMYSGDFTFNFRYGVTQVAGDWPEPAGNPGACSRFPSGGGGGVIHVELQIKPYCSVIVNKHIDFGKQIMINKAITSEGAIRVSCTNNTKFQVGMGPGDHSPDAKQRYMTLGNTYEAADNQKVAYNLYKDAGYTRPWGNVNTPDAMNLEGGDTPYDQVLPVYAQVPPQTGEKTPGAYQDTVLVTVTVTAPAPIQ